MRKSRKVVSMILAVGMMVSMFAGCSNGTASSQSSTASTAAASTASVSNEPVTLNWALWDINLTAYYKPLIDAYTAKHPNVTINMKDLGSAEYNTALGTQLAGGDAGLDVITIKDIPGYMQTTNASQLEDLTPYIKSANIDTSVYGGTTEQITVNGKLFALPFRSDFWVVYYNKDLFDKAKVAYPTNDMTVTQYDELARKMTSGSGNAKVYGDHFHTWRSDVTLFGILDGKHSIYDADTNYDFLKPYYEMALKEQADGICMDYATLKTSNTHYSGVFENNQAAMCNMGSWFIATLIKDAAAGKSLAKNWGIVKYPHPDGVAAGTTLGTITSLGVASTSKHKDVAWDFVKYVTGADGAEVIAKTGTIPAIKNDAVITAIAGMTGFPTDTNSKDALKTVKTYLEMPMNANSAAIDKALNTAHDAIMTKSVSVDDGLKQMAEAVKPLLK